MLRFSVHVSLINYHYDSETSENFMFYSDWGWEGGMYFNLFKNTVAHTSFEKKISHYYYFRNAWHS